MLRAMYRFALLLLPLLSACSENRLSTVDELGKKGNPGGGTPTVTTATGTASVATNSWACDPIDAWDNEPTFATGYGDDCGSPVGLGQIEDSGDSVTIQGNAHIPGDVDWYLIQAVDLGDDELRGYEDFHLQITLSAGAEDFHFQVFRGACTADQECVGETGYDAYSFFSEDTSPDDYGEIPADTRACGTEPLNECPDYTDTWLVVVSPIEDSEACDPYTLDVSNGIW